MVKAEVCGTSNVGSIPTIHPTEGVRMDEEPDLKSGSARSRIGGSIPPPSSLC